MAEEKESTDPLYFREAVNLLCGKDNAELIATILDDYQPEKTLLFSTFLVKQYYDVLDLQNYTGVKLCVVKRLPFVYENKNNSQKLKLLFDGRFVKPRVVQNYNLLQCYDESEREWMKNQKKEEQRFSQLPLDLYRLVFMVLDEKDQLVGHYPNIQLRPRLSQDANFRKTKFLAQPLASLLPFPPQQPLPLHDPESYEETVQFLEKYDTSGIVYVRLCVSSGSKPRFFEWIRNKITAKDDKYVYIEAFTDSNYRLAFRNYEPDPIDTKQEDMFEAMKLQKLQDEMTPNAFQANKSCSVSVSSTGLNLAFRLGSINSTQLNHMARQLSKYVGSLHLEHDDKGHPRYVTYSDNAGYKSFELKCEEKHKQFTNNQWTQLFDYAFARQAQLEIKKLEILQPALQTLQVMSAATAAWSPWKNALFSLQRAARRLTVLVYSQDDSILHELKLYFAHYYAIKKKNKRGSKQVSFKSTAQNDLVALVVPEMMLLHLGAYYNDVDEKILFPLTLPKHFVRHEIETLKRQPYVTVTPDQTNITAYRYFWHRSESRCFELRKLWFTFVSQLLKEFEFDLSSLPFVNLSMLSYQLVWFRLSRLAGPLYHAIEKVKPFNEDLLREFCRGGYSYSCNDKLECGQPIWPDQQLDAAAADNANTCLELDLISSYGWAASRVAVPTGFGVGYIYNAHKETSAELVPNASSIGSGNLLNKTDPFNRQTSFEFLVVYSVIYDVMCATAVHEKRIHACYSNYHPLGYLKIGPYPIDLAIVFTDGSLLLVQADGKFYHGCDTCPPLGRYVGEKTHQQVRSHTETRDAFIREWAETVNVAKCQKDFVTYRRVVDCHEPEFFKSALLKKFHSNAKLAPLVEPYPTKPTLCVEDLDLCNKNLTFVAIVKGKCNSVCGKPLFVWSAETGRQTRLTETGPDQDFLLTRDTYECLKQAPHNFTVTSMTACFFYRKCDTLNRVFENMVVQRAKHKAAVLDAGLVRAAFLKHVINRACGFFGWNQRKNNSKTNCTLVTKLPGIHPALVQIDFAGEIENTFYYTAIRQSFKQSRVGTKRSAANAALPLFVSILEMGKLRLLQVLTFLEMHISPTKWRHLYTNVDNLILAIAAPSLIETIDDPDKRRAFEQESPLYFAVDQPGCVKLEWSVGPEDEWKFVSPLVQNWTVLTASATDSGRHKNTCFNKVSTLKSYETSCKLLAKTKCQVEQVRRVNKLAGLETKVTTFTFNNDCSGN